MTTTSPPLRSPSFSPLATALCSAVVLLLHGVYGGFYIFEAYEYLLQTTVDAFVLTMIYRLLGLGSTIQRAMYITLGVTDTWIAFWHITGLVRAIRASIRFRRLLLDVPDEKISAAIKTKLQYMAHKTGLPAATPESPEQREVNSSIPTLRAEMPSVSSRLKSGLRTVKREYFTMDGAHYETGTNIRKTIEIITQIKLLIQMSHLISEHKINDLAVAVFTINCWATPLLRFAFRNVEDPLPGRVSRQIIGLLLASCFTVAVPAAIWGFAIPMVGIKSVMFDQVLSARVRYLIQNVLVTQWIQVISTRVAACTAILGIETLKRKLTALSQSRNVPRVLAVTDIANAIVEKSKSAPAPESDSKPRREPSRLCSIHLYNVVWIGLGAVVLALHLNARSESPLPLGFKCDMPMHPWLSDRVACAVLEINCFRGGFSGSSDDIDRALLQTDATVLSTLRLTHCPALGMPRRVQTLSNLALLEVYNCSIVEWTAQAALTTRHHPYLGSVWLINVTGIAPLPLGLQDTTFPTADIVISGSDLADLPVSLVDKWPHMMSKVVVEHSRLKALPTALLKISGVATSLAGNNLKEIPAHALQGRSFSFFSVAGNPELQALPDAGWKANTVDVRMTNLSTAPAWMNVGSGLLYAGGTPLCTTKSQDLTRSPWIDCTAPSTGDRVSGLFPYVEISHLRQP